MSDLAPNDRLTEAEFRAVLEAAYPGVEVSHADGFRLWRAVDFILTNHRAEAWDEGWTSAHLTAEQWCARSRACVEENPGHNPYREDGHPR